MHTTFYFVRHGQVENPHNIVYARLPRFRLSEIGRQQAAGAANILRSVRPAAIFSSPMLRARQTAEIISQQHPGVRIQISQLINENYTPFQGASFDIIKARNGDIFTGVEPPYEQPKDFLHRLLKFIRKVQKYYPNQAVIAVTHGDIVRVIILWALGLSLEQDNKAVEFPGTGSVIKLEFDSSNLERPNLEYLSSQDE